MRKKTALIVVVILAFGLVGTGLSALYKQNEGIVITLMGFTRKESYGFPLGWYGYSFAVTGIPHKGYWGLPPLSYWFSLESLLLDVAFWFAVSFFVSFAAIKSARALNLVARIRAGVLGMKTSIILLAMSLLFIVIGVGLCLFAQTGTAQAWFDYVIRARYFDLGLRLIGSGTATLIATLSVMVWKPSNVRVRQGYADDPNSHEV